MAIVGKGSVNPGARQSQVAENLEQVEKLAAENQTLVASLKDRLSPLLRSEPVTGTLEKKQPEVLVSLEQALRTVAATVDATDAVLRDVLDRLEL